MDLNQKFLRALKKAETKVILWNGGDIRVAQKEFNISHEKKLHVIELKVQTRVTCPKYDFIGYEETDVATRVESTLFETKARISGMVFDENDFLSELGLKKGKEYKEIISQMKELVKFTPELLKEASERRNNAIESFRKDFCIT
jgi:hypothetical protein